MQNIHESKLLYLETEWQFKTWNAFLKVFVTLLLNIEW